MTNDRLSLRVLKSLGLVSFLWAFAGFAAVVRAGTFVATNLVTDDQAANPAQITDPHLKNAWGISYSPTGPFWVSANGSGLATLYSVDPVSNVTAKVGLEVTIPGDGSVTGQAFNGGAGFNSDRFLFVSEDGTISGWRGALGTIAENLQLPLPGNVYKGATLISTGGHEYLASANFGSGKIDVLKGDNGAPDLASKFTDPGTPNGYAPFNIQVLGSKVYVTYALQNGKDDLAGPGHGFVSSFDLQGNFLGRIANQGPLNSPWGLAIAPSSFGNLAGDLLVGNFGDGTINAFDLGTNAFVGPLIGPGGTPLVIDGLWGLTTGNGGAAGSTEAIYVSAGPADESHGLFGAIFPTATVPQPSSLLIVMTLFGGFSLIVVWRRLSALNAC